jgi:hypothetical protein
MANVQIAIIDQENTQIALSAPSETQVNIAVPGVQGPVGQGVASGGTTNQVLFKQSSTDYDTAWSEITSDMIGDLEIVDADVSVTAAIAGTKISPDFGSQTVQTTGVVSHALGAAATPTITFTGDTNTGIYSPGADQLAISTGGNGRLFVDANGNVTQQSDSPDLIIKDTQSHTTSDGPLVQFQGRGPNGINYNFGFIRGVSSGINNAGILQFGTNNAGSQDERMRITSAGLVGIGTSDPATLLEVRSATTNAARLRVTGSGTTAGNYRGYEFGAGSAFKGGLLQDESTDLISIFTPIGGQSVNITSAGNVGIGTSDPQNVLHLAQGTGDAVLRIQSRGNNGDKTGIRFQNSLDNTNHAGGIYCIRNSGTDHDLQFETYGAGGVGAPRLTIKNAGNVGIGTSSPSTPLEIRKDSNGAVVDSLKLTNFAGGANEGSAVLFESGGASGAKIIGARQGTSGHQLRFQTASTHTGAPFDRVTINSSGNVGIGTTNVANRLTVVGPATNSAVAYLNGTDAANSSGLLVRAGGTNSGKYIARLQDAAANTRVEVLANGNVGIGTQSPGANLDISSSSNTTTRINCGTSNASILEFTQSASRKALIRRLNGGELDIINEFGDLRFWTASDGNELERARIDSSGRLLVGASSTSSNTRLVVQGNSASPSGTAVANLQYGGGAGTILNNYSISDLNFGDSEGNVGAQIKTQADADWGASDYPGRLVFSTTADGAASPTERMRIDNKGKISTFASAEFNYVIRNSEAAGTTYAFLYGLHSSTGTVGGGTNSFTVWNNGDVANTLGNYGQLTSDERFKRDIVDANSQWDDLKNIRITNYRWKSDPTSEPLLGPIAQELQAVSPGLITTRTADKTDEAASGGLVSEGDEVLGVKTSILYMKAVKALQEAMERIETLESKVAALESA